MYNQRGLPSSNQSVFGLEERVERVLCYVLFWISGLFFLVFSRNPTVRKHAMQSVVIFGVLSIVLFVISFFGGVLGSIWVIGFVFSLAFGLIHFLVLTAMVVAWIFLMIAAFFSPNTFLGGNN